LDVCRVISCCVGQLRLSGKALFLEPLGLPTAAHDDPLVGFLSLCLRPNALQRFGERRHPCPVGFGSKNEAARITCMCESMSPGITVRPSRSMTFVFALLSLWICRGCPDSSNLAIAHS
jgi:hypothetical protein